MKSLTRNPKMKRLSALCATLLLGISLFALPSTPASAGARSGAIYHWDVVQEGSTDVYRVWLRGGEYTDLRADGDGDIDMEVLSPSGQRVAWDFLYDSEPACTVWVPRTGLYTIRIVNSDDFDVTYLFRTN